MLCRVVRKLFTKFQENKLGIYVEGGFFEEVVELLKEFYWKKYLLPPEIRVFLPPNSYARLAVPICRVG